jgi:single-strand DNA-binding protein
MNNLNSVLIEGNLTRDPNLTTLPSGSKVCNFSIATN